VTKGVRQWGSTREQRLGIARVSATTAPRGDFWVRVKPARELLVLRDFQAARRDRKRQRWGAAGEGAPLHLRQWYGTGALGGGVGSRGSCRGQQLREWSNNAIVLSVFSTAAERQESAWSQALCEWWPRGGARLFQQTKRRWEGKGKSKKGRKGKAKDWIVWLR
jgi:hypothetical protein